MAYCTQTDLQNAVGGADRLTQVFDWDGDGTPDAAVIADCIAEACDLIDSFASKRYHVPFSPIPDIIIRVAARLAVLCAYRRRTMMSPEQERDWDQLAGTESGKEGWLYRLATGVVTPGGDPLPPPHTTMAPDTASTQLPPEREVSRGKLGGFW